MSKGPGDNRTPDFEARRASWERIWGQKKPFCAGCGRQFEKGHADSCPATKYKQRGKSDA